MNSRPHRLFIPLLLIGTWCLPPFAHCAPGIQAEEHHEHEAHEGHTRDGDPPRHTEAHEAHGHDEASAVPLSMEEIEEFDIQIHEAASGQLDTQIRLSGEIRVNADRLVHVVPRVPGIATKIHKHLGDEVKAGEVLAVLESRALADTKAAYLATREKVALAEMKFQREQRLWRKKIASEEEYLDAKQQLAELRIEERSAKQKLHALGFSEQYLATIAEHRPASFTRYEIIASIDGTIIEKHITLGEKIGDDSNPFVIADLSRVWALLTIYQKDLSAIKVSQEVLIENRQNHLKSEARIDYISPLVDEATRTATARVVLNNPHGAWKPGMFVIAMVRVNQSPARIVVPQSSLQTMGDATVVFVETEQGFAPKPVTLGRRDGESVEITGGLTLGERYVSKNAFTLKAELGKGAFGHGHAH